MKVTGLVSNFTAGEISPKLDVRVDTKKYANGAFTLENCIVMPHGGVRKRPGTKFVAEIKDSSDDSRLIPFEFNTDQTYMLEFGDGYIRPFKDQAVIVASSKTITGITKANPGVITAASHGFSTGDQVYLSDIGGMTELNNRRVTITVLSANTFSIGVNTSSYTTYTSGGTASKGVEITTTYSLAEAQELTYAQSADTLFLAHKDHPIRKLTRTSHTAWTLSDAEIENGPFRTINSDETLRLTPSSFSGSATAYGTHVVGETFTLTATGGAPFTSDMVGALFRLNEDGSGTGVPAPPLGDSNVDPLAALPVYTSDGKVYGMTNVNNGGGYSWGNWNRVPNHDNGTVRVIGVKGTGSAYFDAVFLHPSYCLVEITGYTSTTVVTCEIVKYHMPESVVTNGTVFWEEGAWSTERGYPGVIGFHEGRLFAAASDGDPQNVWGSRSQAFEDFQDGPDDDHALVYTAASGKIDRFLWMESGKTLCLGTASNVYVAAASSQNEALTPSNVRMVPQSPYGSSSSVKPVRIGNTILFGQRRGDVTNPARKVREFQYSFESDSYNAADVTIVSEHITGTGIAEMAYQADPDSVMFAVRADGQLACLTYETEQDVKGWHRQIIGGSFGSGDAVVERIAVIPGSDGDDVWLIVKRTINGSTKRYIEVLTTGLLDETAEDDAVYLDSALTYDGSETDTITGLWHLEGEEVYVLADGSKQGPFTVSGGSITLDIAASVVQVGLAYTTVIETTDLEVGARAGTAKSRQKLISELYADLYRSRGGRFGAGGRTYNANRMDDIVYRVPADPMGSSPPLKTGLMRLSFPGGWENEAIIRFEHDEPYPFTILGIVAEVSTSG